MTNEERIAILEQKVKILQMFYASALADSVVRYGNEGILEKITGQKKAEQMKTGSSLAERLGITEPKQSFIKIQEIYGCANWVCTETEGGFEAVCTACMLCAISKKMGQFSPCRIYCLSPLEAVLKAVAPGSEFSVTQTLWDSDRCKAVVKLS